MIQALWLLGLLMNGSMQKFVTFMSGDLYPASIGECSVDVRVRGPAPSTCEKNLRVPLLRLLTFSQFPIHCVLVCVHDHYESVTFLPPFSTLRDNVFAEQMFWPCVNVFVLTIYF